MISGYLLGLGLGVSGREWVDVVADVGPPFDISDRRSPFRHEHFREVALVPGDPDAAARVLDIPEVDFCNDETDQDPTFEAGYFRCCVFAVV
ncbi:hypothetical protein ACIQZB_21605 [Streptomyces sp. NPDC097727]|uniref:hypothetical protein n=1 Tax=Streptomyces sp. NPDC097727 TaxID=3366092 RepID=UPI0038307011